MKTISVISLGCDKNLVDSEVVLGKLFARGYTAVDLPEKADWIILNTCAFIEQACQESREWIGTISSLRRADPGKRVLVMGCYAQRFKQQAAQDFPEVDFWLGVNDFPSVVGILEHDTPGVWVESEPYLYDDRAERVLATPAHLAYVKIAEGCSNHCTYCVIPRIRGALRSRTIESLEQEVRELCSQGVREIILLAQDLGSYGLDRYDRRSLPEVLWRLGRIVPEGNWIRLLYLSPDALDERLIEAMASVPQVVPFLDMPLQHADPGVLRRMGRSVDPDRIYTAIQRARQAIPGLFLRTTFMVGFPGEDQAAFQNLLDMVSTVGFERLGGFCYSEQADTPSAQLYPKVPREIAQERYRLLMETQYRLMEAFHRSLVGTTLEVILDSRITKHNSRRRNRLFAGRTYGDAPQVDCRVEVDVSRHPSARPGDIVPVTILAAGRFELKGVIK